MKAKQLTAVVVLLTVTAGFVCPSPLPAADGTRAADKIKIGVSIPSADHGWTGGVVWWANKAIEDWKKKDKDAEFIVVTAESPQKQVSQIETLMVKKIDALVVLPHDSAPLTPVVKQVHDSGIYTVVVDRGLTKPAHDVYIAGDNPGFGREAAKWIAKELKGKGRVVVLEGIPCVINTERVNAFREEMKKHKGITILDSQPAHWSTEKGLQVMQAFLQKHRRIDAVWAGDDDVMKGALQAYKESGRKDVKLFLGGGGSKEVIRKIIDDDKLVRATVTYPPNMVATAVSLAVKGLRGTPIDGFYQQKVPSKIVLSSELVTGKNAKKYYEPESVY
jgi:ribose transport system substrate-binding protein